MKDPFHVLINIMQVLLPFLRYGRLVNKVFWKSHPRCVLTEEFSRFQAARTFKVSQKVFILDQKESSKCATAFNGMTLVTVVRFRSTEITRDRRKDSAS